MMGIASVNPGDTVSLGQLLVAVAIGLVTLVFGWPVWRLARRSQRQAASADEQQRIADLASAVARYLGVPMEQPEDTVIVGQERPSPQHPSVLTLLEEIRDFQEEQSVLALILAYHLADEHGPNVPKWVIDLRERNRARRRGET